MRASSTAPRRGPGPRLPASGVRGRDLVGGPVQLQTDALRTAGRLRLPRCHALLLQTHALYSSVSDPPRAADEEEFIARMRSSRRAHRPWLYPPLTADEYRGYLERLADDRKVGYLACRRKDAAIVGWLNVSEIVRGGWRYAAEVQPAAS